MSDLRMNEAEKARIAASVRTAAIVAAKGRAIGEDSINRIIDEASNPNLSDADRVAIATSRAEQEVGIGKPMNELSATPRELEAKALAGGLAAARMFEGMRGMREGSGASDNRAVDSGARYDGMSTGLNPTQIQTRNYAIQQGVMWAANNPEILKLGNGAIDIIKQTHLRQETLESLKGAGLSTKGSVGIASMLHEKGSKDVNKDGQSIAADINALNDPAFKAAIDARAKLQVPGPNETPEQKKAREAQMPAAEQNIRETAAEHIRKKPEDAARIKRVTEPLGVALEKDARVQKIEAGQATLTAEEKAQTNAKDAKADALLAELSDTKPAVSAPKGQQKAPDRPDPSRPEAAKPPGKPGAGPKP